MIEPLHLLLSDWDGILADYEDRTIDQTPEWLSFITETQQTQPVLAAFDLPPLAIPTSFFVCSSARDVKWCAARLSSHIRSLGTGGGTLTGAVERRRPAASYGPWVPVRCHHVPRVAGRLWSGGEHESARELTGQCRAGKFLPYTEDGTRASSTRSNTRERHYHSSAEFEKMTMVS